MSPEKRYQVGIIERYHERDNERDSGLQEVFERTCPHVMEKSGVPLGDYIMGDERERDAG